MPRTTTSRDKAGSFGRRLTDAREKAGLRLDNAAVYCQDALHSTYGPSRETIRRMENGSIPEEHADMLVVAALASIYGVPVKQLSPLVANKLEHVTPLITPSKRAARTGSVSKPPRRTIMTHKDDRAGRGTNRRSLLPAAS